MEDQQHEVTYDGQVYIVTFVNGSINEIKIEPKP